MYFHKYKPELTLLAFKLEKEWMPRMVHGRKASLIVTFTHMANVILQEDSEALEPYRHPQPVMC